MSKKPQGSVLAEPGLGDFEESDEARDALLTELETQHNYIEPLMHRRWEVPTDPPPRAHFKLALVKGTGRGMWGWDAKGRCVVVEDPYGSDTKGPGENSIRMIMKDLPGEPFPYILDKGTVFHVWLKDGRCYQTDMANKSQPWLRRAHMDFDLKCAEHNALERQAVAERQEADALERAELKAQMAMDAARDAANLAAEEAEKARLATRLKRERITQIEGAKP